MRVAGVNRAKIDSGPVPLDQPGADGTANDAAQNDAAHSDSHRNRSGSGDTGLFEQGCKCQTGRRPAGERDRTGQHAEQGIQPERQRHEDADHVLQDRERRRQQKESQYLRSTDAQQRQARTETDGGEERNHQRRLQRRIELEKRDPLAAGNENGNRHQQAADDGRGNVVSAEYRNVTAQAVSGQQRNAAEGECVDQVKLEQTASPRITRAVSGGPTGMILSVVDAWVGLPPGSHGAPKRT